MEDEFSQHKTRQTTRILDLERDMTILRAEMNDLKNRDQGIRTELDKFWDILVGDNDMGLTGLIERVKLLEHRPVTVHRLLLLSMAMTSFTSMATLVVILVK